MSTRPSLIILFSAALCTSAVAQVSTDAKEIDVKFCLDNNVGAENWVWLIDYFEAYLVAGDFGKKENIGAAYMKYMEYRTGYPSKKMPPLPDREALKQKLIEWHIINGQKTYSPLFVTCFYELNKDFKTYPLSPLKNLASIGEALTSFDLSSGTIMGGLNVSLKQDDFKKDIYKRAVILLSLGEVIYIEEFIKEEAGDDNPVYRSIKNKESISNDAIGTVDANDRRIERKPEPDGGFDSYYKWIHDNNENLSEAKKLGRNYKVVIDGIVDTDGNLIDTKVAHGIGRGYDDVALRLVQTHPTRKWKTGTIGGKPVKVKIELEIDFRKK